MSDRPDRPEKEITPEMRRAMSRRSLIQNELGKAGSDAVKQLPKLGGFGALLGFATRETPSQRDDRLFNNLWMLLMGRLPKPEERTAGMELVRRAATPDEKADAFVDVLWALCQTRDFEELKRPDGMLVRGIYMLALDRDPTEEERTAALGVLAEAKEPAAKAAALEGLFTGLFRSGESVLRKGAGRR